ncbi:MAG: hypothetical protein D6725_16375 [Planctomycetota bacterium]|nr:MAG: hypothetical protein D6725_16375 [Planctomycetota bacterium]
MADFAHPFRLRTPPDVDNALLVQPYACGSKGCVGRAGDNGECQPPSRPVCHGNCLCVAIVEQAVHNLKRPTPFDKIAILRSLTKLLAFPVLRKTAIVCIPLNRFMWGDRASFPIPRLAVLAKQYG